MNTFIRHASRRTRHTLVTQAFELRLLHTGRSSAQILEEIISAEKIGPQPVIKSLN